MVDLGRSGRSEEETGMHSELLRALEDADEAPVPPEDETPHHGPLRKPRNGWQADGVAVNINGLCYCDGCKRARPERVQLHEAVKATLARRYAIGGTE